MSQFRLPPLPPPVVMRPRPAVTPLPAAQQPFQSGESFGPPAVDYSRLGGASAVSQVQQSANGQIQLDPSKAFNVDYIKQVMQKTAAEQGNPPPTQKDYDYWIPKILGIGGNGLDPYWLGRLETPDTGGAGGGGAVSSAGFSSSGGDDDLSAQISALMQQYSGAELQEQIDELLAKHGKGKDGKGGKGGKGGGGTAAVGGK